MDKIHLDSENTDGSLRSLLISFAIELVVYGMLVVGYFLVVLRLLGPFLTNLFQNELIIYAFLGLGLVVAQGVLLETVTSFILDWLNLNRLG
jgi:hypothetical protein